MTKLKDIEQEIVLHQIKIIIAIVKLLMQIKWTAVLLNFALQIKNNR
jgi:hypothetical protein